MGAIRIRMQIQDRGFFNVRQGTLPLLRFCALRLLSVHFLYSCHVVSTLPSPPGTAADLGLTDDTLWQRMSVTQNHRCATQAT